MQQLLSSISRRASRDHTSIPAFRSQSRTSLSYLSRPLSSVEFPLSFVDDHRKFGEEKTRETIFHILKQIVWKCWLNGPLRCGQIVFCNNGLLLPFFGVCGRLSWCRVEEPLTSLSLSPSFVMTKNILKRKATRNSLCLLVIEFENVTCTQP